MRRDGSHPEQGRPSTEGSLFPVIEMPVFRQRYPPELLRPGALHIRRVAKSLRDRLGARSVLGLAFYPWHDQTTLWWFEQGMLSLLAASGWQTTWVTDAHYSFDDELLAELGGHLSVVRHWGGQEWQPPPERFDTVIALFPSDQATRAARQLGARLVTFAIKNVHEDEAHLVERPPAGTPLWHAFAGSRNFRFAVAGRLDRTADAWRLMGAPFPTNRYYFPLRPAEACFDALLFGSKSRDYETAFAALARAGAQRVAAIANTEDVDAVAQSARRHGIDAAVHGPLPHVRLLELLEQVRVVVNPIMEPAESHYSLSVPLAVGRPIVATDRPADRPFAGPGVRLAPLGDVAAWAEAIAAFLAETAGGLPHQGALRQGMERHDVDRFFASAILATLSD